MQWTVSDDCCNNQLLICQEQGESEPTIITYPYDITGLTFEGTIKFSPSIALSLGSGIEIVDIVSFTGSIQNNILTVSEISGEIYLGMFVNGLGVKPDTYITEFLTGSGGMGTYKVSPAQTVASSTMATSRISLQLTSEQTQTVRPSQYPFDLWSIGGGDTTPDITGFFVINAALTRIS